MVPQWNFQEYSLARYLRECIWSLERLDTKFTMIRHSWSTPCFTPDEDSDGPLSPSPCLDDDEDDINGPLFIGMVRNSSFNDPFQHSDGTRTPSGTPIRHHKDSPTRGMNMSRTASSSPVRCSSNSRSSVVYRTRKTSMPLPLGIPEDRVASCDSAYLSPFGSPPTIFISGSPKGKVKHLERLQKPLTALFQ